VAVVVLVRQEILMEVVLGAMGYKTPSQELQFTTRAVALLRHQAPLLRVAVG
jgi:hypothetical protein